MVLKSKYAANDALNVIHGSIFHELKLFAFNENTRTKAHLFAVSGRHGRQFGIVLGSTDIATMHHPAQQTKIVLERCDIPSIPGIELVSVPVKGARFKQSDSKIRPENQTCCLVADETSLVKLLKWYSGLII